MELPSDITNFNRLYTDYYQRFINFANSYVRDYNIAEDITEEAFLYYWEHRSDLVSDSNIPAYILKIIKNKCLNHLYHQQIVQTTNEKMRAHAEWELSTRIMTLEAFDPQELYSSELKEMLKSALKALPPQTRKVFLMSRFQNKSYNEIASTLSLSPKTVEFHISKALRILRKRLKNYFYLFF